MALLLSTQIITMSSYSSSVDRAQFAALLARIPPVMRALRLWQEAAPPTESFTSTEPFFLDTMQAEEWLQWVFLPRMQALLAQEGALPEKLALAPYFEEALCTCPSPQNEPLLLLLRSIDQLFTARNQNNR